MKRKGNDMKNACSRRNFIRRSLAGTAAATGGILMALGCSPRSPEEKAKDPCDGSDLTPEDLKARQRLGYEEESPLPDRRCENCNLWLPPAKKGSCGGCSLFKGPVYASAYCTYWVPQV